MRLMNTLVLLVCQGLFSQAALAEDPDWPCIQALVPEVSLAVLWPVPVDEETFSTWKDDKSIIELSMMVGSSESYTKEMSGKIEDWVSGIDESQRLSALSTLALGIMDYANERRSRFINGILKYSRHQRQVAQQIEDRMTELEKRRMAGESPQAMQEEVETLQWQTRIFDQRERAMASLCEQPVYVEQLMSDALRDIAVWLP